MAETPDNHGTRARLSEHERFVLDFEARSWEHPSAKERAIRDAFGVSPTRYYQMVDALIDSPAALAYDAGLIKRLGRLREDNRLARAPRQRAAGRG